jgi:hypothetical protein
VGKYEAAAEILHLMDHRPLTAARQVSFDGSEPGEECDSDCQPEFDLTYVFLLRHSCGDFQSGNSCASGRYAITGFGNSHY